MVEPKAGHAPRRVDLLGPVPPPFGGVSIHILRFRALLEAEGHTARVLSCTGLTRNGRFGRGLQAAGQRCLRVRVYPHAGLRRQ